MSFAVIQRGDQKWLAFRHRSLGAGYRNLFALGRHDAQALDIYGFKEIRNTPSGQRVVREGDGSDTPYLIATPDEDDAGRWVITLFPSSVLGTVPADIALLMMEGTAVEFPAGATPKDVLAAKANGMETRAAELEARAETLRAEAPEIRTQHGIVPEEPSETPGL